MSGSLGYFGYVRPVQLVRIIYEIFWLGTTDYSFALTQYTVSTVRSRDVKQIFWGCGNPTTRMDSNYCSTTVRYVVATQIRQAPFVKLRMTEFSID